MLRNSEMGGLRGVCAVLLASTVLAGTPAQAASLTLTSHVPAAVANGQAPRVGELSGAERVSLAVSLPLRDQAGLDDFLRQLYDPQSSGYRRYLSVQEFADRFGPAQADHDAVVRFAELHGLTVTGIRANRLVVDLEAPASAIESAFHVNLGVYTHPTENRVFYSPDREPTLDLDVPVLHISGLDNFSLPHAKLIRSSKAARKGSKPTGSGPNGQFIGSDMRAAYYGSGPLTGAGQSVGLVEFGGYEISDVQRYFETLKQTFSVPITGVSVNGAAIDCPTATCDDSEQSLDIEIAISMAPGLDHVYVYVGKNNTGSDVSVLAQMAADNSAAQLSCSWGWKIDESSLAPIFQEFMAQGQTFFDATGDYGSSSTDVWPGDDPFVTGVGGTDLVTNGPGGAWKSETGWHGSAGMINKDGIAIPAYQQLPGVIDSANGGSTTLRNIPDVAAEANVNQYSCFDGYCSGGNGGTSYASPMWAGFMAMVNQESLAKGGALIGFLNPAIYRIGVGTNYDKDFHDAVSGTNGKFSAVTGYDLVTGWGSFIGPKLLNALEGSK
jgi:subtilase family serine protease